ncbi:hypothetical protein [Nioella ostreopsis]|uniref:hypothetical protein n=1 Tax=Nioella ostreopsis TaxID=2448479 RepID=UPI000FDCAF58|nr:hypothetical protein [Nioella ostreopsis]
MRALLLGVEWRKGDPVPDFRELSRQRVEDVVAGLKQCSGPGYDAPIMWMLNSIWQVYGDDAHRLFFPSLSGSYAGEVLEKMRRHYARVQEGQRAHWARQGLKKADWKK